MKEKNIYLKILTRSLQGAPIGLAISTLITVFISICINDGNYYAVVPELIQDFGSELNATVCQTVLSLLYGAVFAGSTVIFTDMDWNLLKQTLTHFLVCFVTTCPIAYVLRWMNHDISGILRYLLTFLCIYFMIWIGQYFAARKQIQEMNKRIHEQDYYQ